MRSFFAVLLCAASISSSFGAAPALRPWIEYKTIIWIGDSVWKKPEKVPLFFQRMREMGVNAGMVFDDGDVKPFVENHFPFYGENLVNRGLCLKFSSKVTDWDKFVTAWAKTRDEAGLVRDYCLDDSEWRKWAEKQMQEVVNKEKEEHPLAYDIRDELSVTYSANPFDYDFSPTALASFRKWLQGRYADLAALNSEWETKFQSWDAVKPFTTDQIKNRMASGDAIPRGKPDWQAVEAIRFDPSKARQEATRWNFAPWCDFRSYMDGSLASALDAIRGASHAADPETPVGIEGTQMPSAFGGYDLWKLSRVLDWVEPYDIGNARMIFGSFMKGKPFLTTVGEPDARAARRRLWHLLLAGDKGCLVWWSEDSIDWKSDDYELTPRAKALAPVLREMRSPLASLYFHAEREEDSIAIVYSQPSIEVDWLMESTVDGSTWLRRFSSFEAEHNELLKGRDGWVKSLEDLGYTPRFVSTEEIDAGALKDFRVVVAPGCWAISDLTSKELRNFYERVPTTPEMRTTLLADGCLAWFDEHGALRRFRASFGLNWPIDSRPSVTYEMRNRMTGPADALECKEIGGSASEYSASRLTWKPEARHWIEELRRLTTQVETGIEAPAKARARVGRYRLGQARLLSFERNIVYEMGEDLKQKAGNEGLETAEEVKVKLKTAAHVYDLRANTYLGLTDEISFTLDPWAPSLFALTAEKLGGADPVTELGKSIH